MASASSTVHVGLEGPQLRDVALGRALQLYSTEPRAATDENVIATATAFETYLTGPAPTARVSRTTETLSKDELEDWRIAIERLEINGSVKGDLNEQQRLYRIEYLASIIADIADDARTRIDALVELKHTVQLIDGVPTPGTVNR